MGGGTQKRVGAWGHIVAIAHVFLVTLAGCNTDCPSGSMRVGQVCRVMASGVAGDSAGAMQSDDTTGGRAASVTGAQIGAGGADAGRGADAAHGGAAALSSTGRAGSGDVGGSYSSEPRAGSDAGSDAAAASAAAAASCMPSNGGTELCDGKDNDCDGKVDEQVKTRCWVDADGDGYAAADATIVETCDMCGEKQTPMDPKSGKADCDDSDATRSPGATDICGDKIDNDCDGSADNSQKNACNGPCTVQLPGKPGDACSNQLKGACARMGVYECAPDGSLRCNAEIVQGTPEVCGDGRDNDCDGTPDNGCVMNSCGGWNMLANPKGTPCSVGSGSCQSKGTYDCVGTDDTACNAKPKAMNSCGGCGVLLHDKGSPCSADCGGTGRYQCAGPDATSCDAVAKPRNDCGGCTTLALNASCSADCGAPGRTMCDGTDRTKCVAIGTVTRNECGGCSPIPSGQSARNHDTCSAGQGVTCIAIGTYVCTGSGNTATTVCDAKPGKVMNECGGCVALNGTRGEACTDDQGFPGTVQCDPSGGGLYICKAN